MPETNNEQRPASAAPLSIAALKKLGNYPRPELGFSWLCDQGEESQKTRGANLVLPVLTLLLAAALTGFLQMYLHKKIPTFIFENNKIGVKALCPTEDRSKGPWILQAEEEIPFPWIFWQLSLLPSVIDMMDKSVH